MREAQTNKGLMQGLLSAIAIQNGTAAAMHTATAHVDNSGHLQGMQGRA